MITPDLNAKQDVCCRCSETTWQVLCNVYNLV